MKEKIENMLKKLNKVDSNSTDYINIISQCEHEIEAIIYGNEKNKKFELINLLNDKNIILVGTGNNLEQRKFLIKAIVFALENIEYIYSIQIEIFKPQIRLKLKVKNYNEILLISENIALKFDNLINEKAISISNLEESEIVEDLKGRFKNQLNITKKIFNERYQVNILSPLNDIEDIKSYSIYITK